MLAAAAPSRQLHIYYIDVYENFLFLLQLITLSSGEVRLYFLEIDLKKQINLLETLLFCLFYICSTRSLIPLSPGSGFTYFLLTATQPRLRTSMIEKSCSQEPLKKWSKFF
jgi:hypothetical protein